MELRRVCSYISQLFLLYHLLYICITWRNGC